MLSREYAIGSGPPYDLFESIWARAARVLRTVPITSLKTRMNSVMYTVIDYHDHSLVWGWDLAKWQARGAG